MTNPPQPGSRDERLQQLMAEFFRRRRNGEAVTPDAWAASHPEFRGALLKLFEQAGQSMGDSATGQADGTVIVPGSAGAGDSETMIEDSQLSGREARLSRDAPPTRFGRYRIIRELGRGAMGAVYLAQDEQLHRQVALKIPQFGADMNRGLLERFYREARAAAALRHPGICPVYDVGEIDGQHYITMAYIEGRPLRDFTKSSKRQAGRQVARVIRKLAQALDVAHQHNVIHRDLKPANVMIDNGNEPVVMDFGLARLSVEGEERLTHTGTVIGTPAYMSPEQVDGDNNRVGPRSDIYSLGVIFYELLTGQLPFQGNLMSILRKIATEEPRPPIELHSDIDPALQAICLKMLAKQPEQRHGSMSEVAQELAAWMQGRSSGVEESGALETSRAPGGRRPPRREELTEAIPADEPPVAEIADDVPEWSESPGRPRRRRTKKSTAKKRAGIPEWVMGAGGAVALLVVIVVLLTRSGPTDQSAAPAAGNTAAAGSSTPQVRNTGPKISLDTSESARRLDLLSMINVSRDGVGRSWSMANGILKTIAGPSEGDRRLYLPIENPPDEYDLRLKVQRATARDNALVLGLISSGHRFVVIMDGFKSRGGLWGVELIDGKGPPDNVTAVRNEPLKVDVPAEVLIQVRKNGIRVERDGRSLIDWTGTADRLSLYEKWRDTGPPRFFLGAQGDFIIHELSLEPMSADESGWVNLSNGRDLSGWKPVGHHGWTVENEVLRGVTTTQQGPGWLMSEREFQDFELEMEYRLSPGSNSGVFLRAGPEGDVGGGQFREIQLLDDGDPSFAAVAPVQRTGAVFGQVAPSPLLKLPASTWHHLRIRLQGQQVQVAINGTSLLDHAVTSLPPKGRIGLQLYPSQVEFRRIRVRPLAQAVGGTTP